MAKLRAYHYTAQTKPDKAVYQQYGLDLEKAAVRNNVEAGVLEAALSKVKIIQVWLGAIHAPVSCALQPRPGVLGTCTAQRGTCQSGRAGPQGISMLLPW